MLEKLDDSDVRSKYISFAPCSVGFDGAPSEFETWILR